MSVNNNENKVKTVDTDMFSRDSEFTKQLSSDYAFNSIKDYITKSHYRDIGRILNESGASLSSEQLADILKTIFDDKSNKLLQSLSTVYSLILSNPNLNPMCHQGLPLILATKYGFVELVKKFLQEPNIVNYNRNELVGEISIKIPYYALWVAYKQSDIDIAQLIMEKISSEPKFTTNMLLPSDSHSILLYPRYNEEIKHYKQTVTTLINQTKLKNEIVTPESTTEFIDACKKKDNNLIQQLYPKLKMENVDGLFAVFSLVITEKNYPLLKIMLEDHGSRLFPEHLAHMLKVLHLVDDISQLQSIRKCCEIILLNPKLTVNCHEGTPLMVAAKHGLIEIAKSILNNPHVVFYSTTLSFSNDTIPFGALFMACKYGYYDIAILILEKIMLITPKYDMNMLFPLNERYFVIYKQKLHSLTKLIDGIKNTNNGICHEAIKNSK